MAGSLSSLKVLDFSTLLPGPFGTMMLADLGAEVLRIESPTRPDMVRIIPPMVDGVSAAHAFLNRSKRSLAVDLKKPEGVELIKQLVAEYDIIVEQFRPGVMARLGLDYDTLKAINPGLIYCSITGYGQTGPYRNRAGHDMNYLSVAGVLSYNGRRETGPAPMAVQVADVAGGSCHAVTGVLAAVIHRMQTGEGQQIDISMTDAAFSFHALTAPGALQGGDIPEMERTQLNGGSFYDCYETADGRYLSVGGLEPQFGMAFCQAIGKPQLASRLLITEPVQLAEVKQEIAQAIKTKSLAEWQAIFTEVDACVEPVLNFSEACEHPQIKARNMVVDVPSVEGGAHPQLASPFKMSATPPEYRYAGVSLGRHTRDVLAELGLDDAAVAELRDKRVVQ